MRPVSLTSPLLRCTQRFSTRDRTCARNGRCTGCWRGTRKSASVRNQLRHPQYSAPELLATRPNQLWSWDISKLRGAVKWSYSYLYVILDVYSRYVVGWMVASRESAALAKRLIRETCERQGIARDQLTIHADRGSSMKSKAVALLLSDLGVTKTHSRPHVSNDNPYSESHFKTLKYRPEFPRRFGCIEDARSHCADFFRWYNTEHRHTGLGLLTPADVHHGLAKEKIAKRASVLSQAHAKHPERFPRGVPQPPALPKEVWINKPPIATSESIRGETVETEAQNRRLTHAMDSGIHLGTPETEAPELDAVVL